MKELWNQRYDDVEYAYGTEPNLFFKQQLDRLDPGKILLPAEGEGRNAVYAALNGWEVTAFDPSEAAKDKAEKLANRFQVEITYLITDIENFDHTNDYYDCIGLIFAHFPPTSRSVYHQKLIEYMKSGGSLILEGFSKAQISNNSGGPKNIDMLFSESGLKEDFRGLSNLQIQTIDDILHEGQYHQGSASLIRLNGIK